MQTICNSTNILTIDCIERLNKVYPTLEDSEFEGFDVRNDSKSETNQTKEKFKYFENQTKVSLEILKKRIVGFDGREELTETGEEVVEDREVVAEEEESMTKTIRNFKVESYKSKLKEILGSKSTDSNTDSQDMDSQVMDSQVMDSQSQDYRKELNCSENFDTIVKKVNENDVVFDEELTKTLTKMESLSTNYEEVNEYQKSITSCSTEGPEFQDCADCEHKTNDKLKDLNEMTDNCLQTSCESIHKERNNCRRFINSLKLFLARLLSFRSSVEADQALQVFASDYCTGI